MKMKSLILLVMAIGCGFVAMLGVQQVLSGDKKPRVETSKVLIAVTNIQPGQPLDDTNVAFKDWPKEEVPEGAVTAREQFAERSLRVAAVPNEVIMSAKLNEKGVFGGSSEIPKGMRVATVPVNVTKTHSGLIMPGDRVDVVVTYTFTAPNRGQIQKAKTILQYIEVFATDNIRQSGVPNAETKEVSAKNISLIVTPDQYNLLMLAESKGKISLALRHRGDDAEVHPADVDETMFDGVRITRGQSDEKEEGAGEEQDAPAKERGKNHGKVAAKVKEDDNADKPTWTLKIFEGDKLREEQVELPQEPGEAAKTQEKPASHWPAFLKGFFHRAT
jgi:pilus assembly protein CpaB